MNHMIIQTDPIAPWNEQEPTGPMPCDCGKFSCNRYADELDPIIVDGRYFSDYCASNLVTLRFEEVISGVSAKTKKLVKVVDDENYMKVWQQEFDKSNRVKHI